MAKKGLHAHIWVTFFVHNSAIFGLTFYMGAQETIIYRFVMMNPSFDTYFLFLGHFCICGKMGVATTRALNGLRLPKFQGVNPLK